MLNCFPNRLCAALLAALLMVMGFQATDSRSSEHADAYATVIAPAFQKYCFQCHDDTAEGDVNLSQLRRDSLMNDVELVRGLIDVLDLKQMPPEDEPQPGSEQRQRIVSELKKILHDAASRKRTFPHAPIRRMNRFQYNNAVTDLFDLNCVVFTLPERMMREHNGYFQPASGQMAEVVTVGSRPLGKSQMIERRLAGVAAFPQDLRAEHGFDNRGDHLSLSPLLMEQFLKLGQSVTESPDFVPRNVGIWSDFFVAPTAKADMGAEVRQRLDSFLTRAFRRPVEQSVLDRYVRFVLGQLESGHAFTDAMKAVAAATISSPRFLYLYDTSGQSDDAEAIDDFELASRLSFFLWGSIPDSDLLDVAATGDLKKPDTLEAQVDRMLKDRKLKRFCDSFPSQWLQLDRIISSKPNREKYPGFYFAKYLDSMHMMMEPLLLFETVLIENLPITTLIDSEFTYRSRILDEAYDELGTGAVDVKQRGGGVTVLSFQRVPVTDRRSGGVITNAAVMTMTSSPDRTQPITRGAWLATVIFNNPPNPPPADVPPLDEKPPAGEEHLTLRERLAAHRERSDCKGCHEKIDPLGFALENYDPIGVWRDEYDNGRSVDMAGSLFRKHSFDDVAEFKEAILAEKDRFTIALAGHLLAFGLARELAAEEQLDLEKIAQATAADDYRFQTLLKQVILSEPFLHKTNPKNAEVNP